MLQVIIPIKKVKIFLPIVPAAHGKVSRRWHLRMTLIFHAYRMRNMKNKISDISKCTCGKLWFFRFILFSFHSLTHWGASHLDNSGSLFPIPPSLWAMGGGSFGHRNGPLSLLSDGFARTKRNWRWNPFCVVGRVLGGVLCSGISPFPLFLSGKLFWVYAEKNIYCNSCSPEKLTVKMLFFSRENCRLPLAILFFLFVWARFFLNDTLVSFLLSS